MKKLVPPTLVALMLAALVAIPLPAANAQAGLVSSMISRLQRNQENLKSMRANITMEKYNSQLRDKDNYSGMIFYIPGPGGSRTSMLRLEWTKPQHETLTVASGNYQLYRPRLGTVLEGRTGGMKGKEGDLLSFLNMSAAQLRTRFETLEYGGEETLWGGVWTQHMKATPKGPANYKYIELWIDKEGMPVQTKMVEKNDDSTTVRLSNVERNQNISNDQFKQNFDSSVKHIKG
ncbi:MAG TPA: outer membrane lipoprotein carrier protein LolA [Pyrinomonadaceae bacterium]|nr:outer membrane lipoprotein carrier protein LolA [Pyrinomonadaceae bacterium]